MQKTVSLSSAEAEYYSASEIAVEIIYLRNLLSNMRLQEDDVATTPRYSRTTRRASSGQTMSWADANVPSTSTSESI